MTVDHSSTPANPRRRARNPMERLQRLQRDMETARQAAREYRQKALAALGTALLEEAKARPEFMAELRRILDSRGGAKGANAAVIELLDGAD